MARIVEFHSSEQPHISMSESLNYRLAEPLVYRDLDGVLADIPAACCRRCGEARCGRTRLPTTCVPRRSALIVS